jgi:hypothetical protein
VQTSKINSRRVRALFLNDEGGREGGRTEKKEEKRGKGREVGRMAEGSEAKAENLIFRISWIGAAYTEII